MAQIAEILQIEKERAVENSRVIHLFEEGTFYRAYEWSAWLCYVFINKFKVTHRNFKNVDSSVAFVGFPMTSLEKYKPEMSELVDVGQKKKDLLLPDSFSLEGDIEELQQAFLEWKESIPMMEQPSKKKDSDKQPLPFSSESVSNSYGLGITGVMQKILAFPLESRTPFQCMSFIAEIKQELSKVI